MNWQEVRSLYPHQWVILEAFDAYTEGSRRVVDELSVYGGFDGFYDAWDAHKKYADGKREIYVYHTFNEELKIGIMDRFFRRVEENAD